MSVVKDLMEAKTLAASGFDKVTSSLEAEIDKMMTSINNVSSRTFKETESLFSVMENHLAADARLGLEEAKKIVAEIKAKI